RNDRQRVARPCLADEVRSQERGRRRRVGVGRMSDSTKRVRSLAWRILHSLPDYYDLSVVTADRERFAPLLWWHVWPPDEPLLGIYADQSRSDRAAVAVLADGVVLIGAER